MSLVPTVTATPPARYLGTDAARARFGDRVDRLWPYLWRGDDAADAAVASLAPGAAGEQQLDDALSGRNSAPAALRSLVEASRVVPPWVEWERVDRGGRFFLRAGILGGIVLGTRSLVLGYASPAGNKPLVLSGRLREAAAPRLHETSRFVQSVVRAGSVRPGADAWRITLRVRLMHAKVRRMILASSKWRAELWGLPINQHDMVATSLLFSNVTLGGLRLLGLEISQQESDDFMHLWRWVSHVMGVDPALVPGTEAEGLRLGDLIGATQAPPDDDSRALTLALLEHGLSHPDPKERALARRNLGLARAIARLMLGDVLADQLGLARARERFLLPPAIAIIRGLERARLRSPTLEERLVQRGERYWNMVLDKGLGYATRDFAIPERLARS
jgi:hypothetical protein